jgi:hypothetical protein
LNKFQGDFAPHFLLLGTDPVRRMGNEEPNINATGARRDLYVGIRATGNDLVSPLAKAHPKVLSRPFEQVITMDKIDQINTCLHASMEAETSRIERTIDEQTTKFVTALEAQTRLYIVYFAVIVTIAAIVFTPL